MTTPYHQREFVALLADGAGPMTIVLLGNKSYNILEAPDYNFDFLNASTGEFWIVTDPSLPNLGTIGSSDGSVPFSP